MVTIHMHFDYLTPFSEAENDKELATIARLKYPKACSKLEVDASFFAEMVRDMRKYEAWRVIGCRSFEDFCRDKLGQTLDEVEQIVTGVKVLQSQGATKITRDDAKAAYSTARKVYEHGGERKQDNNVILVQGNSTSYLAGRIKRDHPDIEKRIKAGEFKSMRAAAIAAGIVKVPTAYEQVCKGWNKLNASEKRRFRLWIDDGE